MIWRTRLSGVRLLSPDVVASEEDLKNQTESEKKGGTRGYQLVPKIIEMAWYY